MAAILAFALVLMADGDPSPGILRGELLVSEGTPSAGTLAIRDEDSRVTRCSYDAKSYVEIQTEHATMTQLRAGDRLEVLVDRQPAAPGCYIRSLHLLPAQTAASGLRSPYRIGARRSAPAGGSAYVLDSIYPRGNLTFSGVVTQLNEERLVLHTRSSNENIFLRSDTRYLESGLSVDSSRLQVNRRVFVRAGRNLDNELEAYQVVWGEILQPK